MLFFPRERMSRRSTQCTRYATKIKDESSEIKSKISGMAKNNHSTTVGFKGLTHSISYNVRTTTCTAVLASAAQANTTPMQKPKTVIEQACLSSAVLTPNNILLPAGVICRCTAVIVPIVFRQERISFYPKIVIISCFRTACLLYTSPSPRDKRQSRMPSSA